MPYRVVLDDDVMGRIQELADPWIDSPNNALRKALDMDSGPKASLYFEVEHVEDEKPALAQRGVALQAGASASMTERTPRRRTQRPRRRNRAPKGSLLDERAYWRPILEVLANSPTGAVPARDVIKQVEKVVDDKLKPLDRERLESGGLRWHTRVMFARFRLKEAGLLRGDSPRGVWEISDRGREALTDKHLLTVATD